jgi:hypothetical protein
MKGVFSPEGVSRLDAPGQRKQRVGLLDCSAEAGRTHRRRGGCSSRWEVSRTAQAPKEEMMRYYLEIIEDGYRVIAGGRGYEDSDTAHYEAEKLLDDALPRNQIFVLAHIGTVYLGGDGSTCQRKEE